MNRMTLLEYIECQNIKRKIRSKTKSKNKQIAKQLQTSPLISNIRYTTSPTSIKQTKVQQVDQKSSVLELDSKISVLSQSIQIDSFVVMNQKIQQIKEVVRQKIQNDKSFAMISKMLGQLQQILRLQIMKTYRLQLYKFQFQNEKTMNQQMKIILNELNNKYIQSQIKYKKSLQKGKTQLTEKQKQMIASIHDLGEQKVQKIYNLKQTHNISQSIYMGQATKIQKEADIPQIKTKKLSFMQTLIAKGQQMSNTLKESSKQLNQKATQQIKIAIKPNIQKEKAKKVKWTQSKQQVKNQYPLPSFIHKISEKEEPLNIHDQSQIYIKEQVSHRQQAPQQNGKQSVNLNMPNQILKLLKQSESKQDQNKFSGNNLNKDKEREKQLKQTIKQSKDYLRIGRSPPSQKNQKSKGKNNR